MIELKIGISDMDMAKRRKLLADNATYNLTVYMPSEQRLMDWEQILLTATHEQQAVIESLNIGPTDLLILKSTPQLFIPFHRRMGDRNRIIRCNVSGISSMILHVDDIFETRPLEEVVKSYIPMSL